MLGSFDSAQYRQAQYELRIFRTPAEKSDSCFDKAQHERKNLTLSDITPFTLGFSKGVRRGSQNRGKGGNENGGFVTQGGAVGHGLPRDPDVTGLGSIHEDPKNVTLDE